MHTDIEYPYSVHPVGSWFLSGITKDVYKVIRMHRCHSLKAMQRYLIILASFFMFPTVVNADSVRLTFLTTIGSSAISGIAGGDIFTLEVTADNGGTSLISQTWLTTEVLSATATVGTYQATYNAPYLSAIDGTAFMTDASGQVSFSKFGDIGSNNQDVFGVGGSVAVGSDAIRDFYGNLASYSGCVAPPGIGSGCSDDTTLWSVATVPIPSSLLLFYSGLLGLAGIYRVKRT